MTSDSCHAGARSRLHRCRAGDGVVVVGCLRDEVELGAARGGVGREELGDVFGGAVGAVAFETLERELVEGLHRRRQAGAGSLLGVGKPAPHLHRVPARRVGPARAGGLLCCHLDGGGETARGVPDAQPAITEPARAPDRRVGAAADDDGNRLGRRGGDDRFVEVEEPAVEGDRLTGQQLAHDREAFVHPLAPGRRVHPADRDLVAVLTAYPDPEDEPPGGEPGDVGELAGHQDGMAQRQQVHAGVDGQRGMKHRQRGGLHEPVEPQRRRKAHVVAAADVVDACLARPAPGMRGRSPGPAPAGRRAGTCRPGLTPQRGP